MSVPGDDRTAPPVVDADGDEIDILTDAIGPEERACGVDERVGAILHEEVIVFDDNGAHPGMAAAEFVADSGARLELVTPERFFAPEMGGLNVVPYMQIFTRHGVTITTMTRVRALKREGNKIKAILWSPYTEADSGERIVDQVVVENGTTPLADLYFELKEESLNRGEIDYQALIAGRPQATRSNPKGKFQLYRIGDAVASRNIHAAIYDALRLCKDF